MEFEENRAATKSPTPSSSEPSHEDLHHVIYVVMNSLTYFVLCLAVIFLLVLTLLFLVFIWYWWLRPKINFSRKTVHYSAIHSDDDDVDKNRQKSGYMPQRYGQDPVYHQLRASSQHHISQKSSKQWGGSIPVNPHMDINAGHLLLTYIEDNLKDKDRLDKEWEQLQTYLPDDVQCVAGLLPRNRHKNRYPDIIPYDHSRVKLDPNNNISGSDYINASYIIDVDPKHPTYIAAQSPMQHTISDFWQMVWEQNVSVVIMLTPLSDMGLSQSCQYWPTNGVTTYFDYEVHLVSEHHHTVDYIVRSFYIVNIKQKISRTVTQFHFQTWSSVDPLSSPTPLLEFRRKVRIAQTQPNTPLLVHCNDGIGRTGTYCLIDMTLSRITSGAKEINLAATVEHLRDQRPLMVKRKDQFEVALVALVEETERMLEAAAQRRLPVY